MSNVIIFDDNYKNINDIDWDFPNSKQDMMASIHPYPARFINEIPGSLIDVIGCSHDALILDPFCGSGTTLAEAKKRQFGAIGIDLNPIACLISRVRTMDDCPHLMDIADSIIERSRKLCQKEMIVPSIPNLDHWFKKDIQQAINAILFEINRIESPSLHDVLSLALSAIIVRVSNQESDTRYAAIEKSCEVDDVFKGFHFACSRIDSAFNTMVPNSSRIEVINKDILQVSARELGSNIGLVITSPPYPNAYEYWLYHKYRMWWLGYDPIQVREYEIGARPKYHKKNGQTEIDFMQQMMQVFDLQNRCLIDGGHICYIVGRSIIHGREIDNADLISRAAQKYDMKKVACIERTVSSSKKSFNLAYGKIKTEKILIFRKGI